MYKGVLTKGVGFYISPSKDGPIYFEKGTAYNRLEGKIIMTVLTIMGEIPGRPSKGSDVMKLVFEPDKEAIRYQLGITITEALERLVPEIIPLGVEASYDEDESHVVSVIVRFYIRSDVSKEAKTVRIATGGPYDIL